LKHDRHSNVPESSMKVLIIHEHYNARKGIVRDFRRARAEVYATSSGEAGISALHELLPDIIVTDFYLDDMNAFEFYEQIKPVLAASAMRFVIVSALRFTLFEREDARNLKIPVYYLGAFSAKQLIKSYFAE